MTSRLPGLSLYVHLPWCIRKCPYCDFNSHTAGDATPRGRYVEALLADLRLEAEAGRVAGRPIDTLFIGGGTPSLFDAQEIATIIEAIDTSFTLASDAEVTMEANPGAVERGNLRGYRQAGVNRLSLGAQSFSADSLSRLGRIHGPDDITAAFDGAVEAGFDNINLDLMFALPGQSLAMARQDVERAIALQPQHISYYQLTLEPNTVFHARPPGDLPDDDLSWSVQQSSHELLARAGMRHYEISAFALPGRECRHNLNYWRFGDYLAVGAGAHGKFTRSDGGVWRYQKPVNPAMYMEQAERGSLDTRLRRLVTADVAFEFMMNVLRLPQGFTEAGFSTATGMPISAIADALNAARSDKLLSSDSRGNWQPTALGLRFLNDLQARFLPPETPQTSKTRCR